jgi:hypothetical protein
VLDQWLDPQKRQRYRAGVPGQLRRRTFLVALVATMTGIGLGSPPAFGAAGNPVIGPGTIEVGRVTIAAGGSINRVLLVPVRYPLEAAGRLMAIRVVLRLPDGRKVVRSRVDRPHAGRLRPGDHRAGFRFVHSIQMGQPFPSRPLQAIIGRPVRIGVSVSARPVSEADRGSLYRGSGTQVGVRRAAGSACASSRLLLVGQFPGYQGAPLPRCGRKLSWTVFHQASAGTASVIDGWLRYVSGKAALGTDQFTLRGYRRGLPAVFRTYQVRVRPTDFSGVSVRALGDSVTAGFGYFGKTGRPMPITDLLQCRPGATVFNDACSSNSYNRSSAIGAAPDYLPDYGLARNISWAAQWANEYGITDYRNYAVTGSAPEDWLPGGQFHQTLLEIEQQNPDYILMTMGANPLLSDMLFGVDNMGCAIESDLFGDYKTCIEAAFDAIDLDQKLNDLYSSLVDGSDSKLVVMQYHLSIPSSALAYSAAQIELMGELMNEVIAEQAAAVSTDRIAVVAPPRFFVGIDMEPLYPSDFSCSWAGFAVDGPSVQATPTQDELLALHPLSFCQGPAVGPPWVISGDTGIHPSAVGYTQMAGQVPPPE